VKNVLIDKVISTLINFNKGWLEQILKENNYTSSAIKNFFSLKKFLYKLLLDNEDFI
jgi:hypothetical protein